MGFADLQGENDRFGCRPDRDLPLSRGKAFGDHAQVVIARRQSAKREFAVAIRDDRDRPAA